MTSTDDTGDATDLQRLYQRVDLRTDRPTPARMYDYFLDGKDNFAVDREAADVVIDLLGEQTVKLGPQENRAFLRRAGPGARLAVAPGPGRPPADQRHLRRRRPDQGLTHRHHSQDRQLCPQKRY